jgi:hypothetical protein
MTLTLLIVAAAVLALIIILRVAIFRALQVSDGNLDEHLTPLDLEAFRNLVNPSEDEYLRRHLCPSQFRRVQRKRLRAVAAYVRDVGRNAAVLVQIGQSAIASHDPRARETAQHLVNDALLLRRNAGFALVRIRVALVWPNSGWAATPIVVGYEHVSGSARLLGRLQDRAFAVRLSATP